MINDNKVGIAMEIVMYQAMYLESLNVLLNEAFSVSKVAKAKDDDIELVAVKSGEVVGYLALNRCIDTVTGSSYFHVNYVCVKEIFQGQGIASLLFDRVFAICKQEHISYLELTSNPKRTAAYHLYHKLGFYQRETTVFRKELV